MKNTGAEKNGGFKKDIFTTGKYVQHFTPDDWKNPFAKIYKQKKLDTLNIIKNMKDCECILDVGGGMGRLSLALAASTSLRVVLSDISVDMLGLSTKNAGSHKKLELVNTDAHELPFQDRMFDLVAGLDLLCHLESPEKALKEFYRVLKDQGVLILDSTNSNPIWTLFYPRYLGKNPINWIKTIKYQGVLPGWETIVRHYPKNVFFSFLNEAGFKIIKTTNYGPKICSKWHLAVSKKIL